MYGLCAMQLWARIAEALASLKICLCRLLEKTYTDEALLGVRAVV
jgi:hypothetical protein